MLQIQAAPPKKSAPTYVVSPQLLGKIEQAAPGTPFVKPTPPRKVLVYGRVPTHPESVACCFKAMEIMGRKSGAFKAVCCGDPIVFLPESLKQYDAVVMNNTHERNPMLPENLDQLKPEEQAQARKREPLLQKSLLAFVASGKGLVGIHGTTAGTESWREFADLFQAQYAGHFAGEAWIKPEDPDHPLTAFLKGKGFSVHDEIYLFRKAHSREPFQAKDVRVLLSLDLSKMADPQKRADRRYVMSWIRTCGQGRVFYCALGHVAGVYANPDVLRHYLAGIQWALGDLKAEASPSR
jgi:type 1 glutamine amidotransferase